MVVNPRVVKANEKDGDWGAAWLASNGAGSGAYQLDAATYRPLERADLKKNDGHFLGWGDNPKAPAMIQVLPTRETSTRVLALLQGSVDMTDSYLPTDQVERIAEVQGRARREEHVHARLHPAHEQQEAALRQHQRAQVLRPRLQLRRLHQGDPQGLRRAQPGAHAQQPVGLPQGRGGLRLRSEEGQGVLRQGQGRGRADRPADPDPHPVAARADQPGRAAVPERPRPDRREPQDHLRHLGQHHHQHGQGRVHARSVDPLGLDLLRRSRELGRPDVRQPVPRHLEGVGLVSRTPRSTSCCARRA